MSSPRSSPARVVEVRSTAGDTHLGGDDVDRRLVDHLAEEFQRDNGIDLHNDPQALRRLFEAAEKAKVELSSVTQTQVSLPFATADATGPKTFATADEGEADPGNAAMVAALEDRLRRALADLENLCKRHARELDRQRTAEANRMAAAWLPMLDNLDLALSYADTDPWPQAAPRRAAQPARHPG